MRTTLATRPPTRRPGHVVVAVAVSLVVLLSFVALSVDGGMLLDTRRQVQSASDAAALAAAGDLYYRWQTERGSDVNKTARAAALAAAKENGFEHGVNCTVTISVPPTSGPFAAKLGHAEVVITYPQKRYFSQIFASSAPIDVSARAVARGRTKTARSAIICLDPDNKGALSIGGNGIVDVNGAPIQVNSTNTEAAIANGGGKMDSYELDIGGGYSTPGGGSFVGPMYTNTEPIPDPLAYMIPPNPSTLTVRETNKLQHSSASTLKLKPGVYQGGISISGKGNIELEPGIYYMEGGGFNWGGQGSLTGVGVMIYNKPSSVSDKIDLSGQGACTLSPMLTGPYQGILFWQDRTANVPVNVTGNGLMNITGTFYAAGAEMKVAGNGTSDFIGSQYIVDTLTTTGNGNFSIDWSANTTPAVRELILVE